MSQSNYCIICGRKLKKNSSDDFCSEKCYYIFSNFKKNNGAIVINGYCSYCGMPHELIIYYNEHVPHRHKQCYQHPSHPIDIIEKKQKKQLYVQEQIEQNEQLRKIKEKEENERERKRIEKEENERERERIEKEENERERERIEKRKNSLLADGMLYDNETHLLICPICEMYSVEYAQKINGWYCSNCKKKVKVKKSIYLFNLNFIDTDKYHIYKYYGLEPLSNLTDESLDETQNFIASYFEKCCTSMGDKCVYYNHFEDVQINKQINSINDMFDDNINKCKKLHEEILNFSAKLNGGTHHPQQYQKLIEIICFDNIQLVQQDYLLIKEAIETIITELEYSIIATASVSLQTGQKIFLQNNEDGLIAKIKNENGYEAYCWTDAVEGEMVGVCAVSPDTLDTINKMFKELKDKYEEILDLRDSNLSSLEKQIIFLILENNGYLQNELWKTLNIDSRKCSRNVKKLIGKELISRKPAVNKGSRTYKLYIKN